MAKSLSELKRLQRTQLSRLTKEDLIDSILAAPEPGDGQGQLLQLVNNLVSEVAELRKAITAPDSSINKKIDQLQTQVEKQGEVIAKQQRYLEAIDRKERERNLIITGVPDEDEALEGATSEQEKIDKIWSEVGVREAVQLHRRLGSRGENHRRRAILVTLDSKEAKDRVLTKASKLKEATGDLKRVFIKKDVHPNIRAEWRRLREAERSEKGRPENAGCVVRLDVRERKLYRDRAVIDAWNLQFF